MYLQSQLLWNKLLVSNYFLKVVNNYFVTTKKLLHYWVLMVVS